MIRKTLTLSKFLAWSAKKAGNPITFAVALFVVSIWLIIGFVEGFSETWLLVLNTIEPNNAL